MIQHIVARFTGMKSRQTVIVAVIVIIVLSMTGFGLLRVLPNDAFADSASGDPSIPRPPEPAVTAVPSTTSTEGTQAAPERAATSRPTITLSLAVTDPVTVHNPTGEVSLVTGDLTGSVRWTEATTVAAVTLVVQTWTPSSGWTETHRVTVSPAGTAISLGDALGARQVYATGPRANEFSVGTDDETRTRHGAVAVTAVLHDADGTEVTRKTAVASYRFNVTNTASKRSDEHDEWPVLSLGGNETDSRVVDVENVVPGSTGSGRISVSNAGSDTGVLHVAVENPLENGRTEPERSVDGTPTKGELTSNLDVRITLVDSEGTILAYLAGNESTYVPLSEHSPSELSAVTTLDPGQTVSLVVDWRVDTSVGNEIQSDAVTLDFAFTLSENGSVQQRDSSLQK
ncbi:hypothetical protein [Haladaptatus sp. NG-SE-30]